MKPDKRRTGTYLRRLREDFYLTLREAAAKLDCEFTYLSKIENGVMDPSWKFLKKCFDFYKISDGDKGMFAYWYLRRKHFEELQRSMMYIALFRDGACGKSCKCLCHKHPWVSEEANS